MEDPQQRGIFELTKTVKLAAAYSTYYVPYAEVTRVNAAQRKQPRVALLLKQVFQY
jgi:hypothetical protein